MGFLPFNFHKVLHKPYRSHDYTQHTKESTSHVYNPRKPPRDIMVLNTLNQIENER